MHAVRRRILRQLLLRIEAMKIGFTFIERGENGEIENVELEPFESLVECCSAAQSVVHAGLPRTVERVEVVPCEYDGARCHPQVMSVMKTFRRSAQ